MGFLKHFINTVIKEGSLPATTNSFERIDRQALEAHIAVSRYGAFELTDAIRPSYDLCIVPEEGVRLDLYEDQQSGLKIPVLMAAVSMEKLFDTFMDLLDTLAPVVDVVLESSHYHQRGEHEDLLREGIDLPVLKSILYDYEDLLTNDGCTGIAVLNPSIPYEIQFDEHKLLLVYGQNLQQGLHIFNIHRIARDNDIRFITEAEHIHSSRESYRRQFERLKADLAIESYEN